ncbi:MAG: BON domain-containing protein [Fimbriiglobus sp.]
MALSPLKLILGLGVIGGSVAAGKKTDADILAKVGAVAVTKVKAGVPDLAAITGPFAAFKPGRALPVEERVRVRIDNDKTMGGATVDVLAGGHPGEVKLRGVVPTAAERDRAEVLALDTVGVVGVVNEVAVPER